MIIGVDIDGTIKHTQEAAVRCFNDELDRTVRCEDIKEFHLDKAFGLTRKEGRTLWRKLEPQIYTLAVPMKNAAATLQRLKEEGHRIVFITARPGMKRILRVTEEWLNKHGFPYDGTNLVMGAQDKARVARKVGVDLFFEDAPQHLDKLVASGIPTVIMDAAYNRDVAYSLPRISSWAEGYEYVEKYQEQSRQP
ncbi:5' nucleotidase, NT5C type [Paludifilum halophilum]|uniref:Nucleotidase n=1 Tax=Paludifilum halophilum TaxID=1642702 RepID=A0A235B974_9BACL|nr:hypothetical protein [Paludifilum halophilum]OYD08858.1 hypothetical protein CHM34_03470 [Paludifilum halophilum]